jgi:DNA-binding response OmpR family regulator
MMKTVLVVEDEPQIAQIAADYLHHAGFHAITTGSGMDALDLQMTA